MVKLRDFKVAAKTVRLSLLLLEKLKKENMLQEEINQMGLQKVQLGVAKEGRAP